ncbi:DUF2804 domain-containing protein [Hahella aquimaris]|uniref:DUF2804 domain-containing protein n=1 Tax=Hahella sp. HNIBRBA332 TaxID=3015983 RepID=UPI00273B3BEF|nr:DUF2804 domain-containing protein [Hahella sp. HNIBRBA332]WLQ14834.1 DUF2804 domain-containing protein [Hahella sp. HNIBRBA332]
MTSFHTPILIGEDGQPAWGRFSQPVGQINYWDYDLRTPMDQAVGPFFKEKKFNQFQFFGLLSQDLIIGVAIVDLKWVSNAFLYCFNGATGEYEEFSFLQPLSRKTHVSVTPDNGDVSFGNGKSEFYFNNFPSGHKLDVVLQSGLQLSAYLDFGVRQDPLRLCCPAGYNGWVYTQKSAGLPVSGHLIWKGHKYLLEHMGMMGSSDWSCGFMRRETVWKWACVSGVDSTGRRLGLNLANGVNETGMTENAMWLNGMMHPLEPVRFRFNRREPFQPWRVYSESKKIDLTFTPRGCRRDKINLWLLASNFRQMFGSYNGRIVTAQGEAIDIIDQPGFAEDHYAKW